MVAADFQSSLYAMLLLQLDASAQWTLPGTVWNRKHTHWRWPNIIRRVIMSVAAAEREI